MKLRHYPIVALLLYFTLPCRSQTYTVETVPNTKVTNNRYVSDPDHIIRRRGSETYQWYADKSGRADDSTGGSRFVEFHWGRERTL